MTRESCAPAAGLGVVEDNGIEIGEIGLQQRRFMTFGAGHEDEATGLVLDEAFEPAAFFGGELAVFLSDIADKDDIVLREFVEAFGKLLDVIFVAATGFAKPEDERGDRRG